jgi:cell division protein FtsQ
MRKRRKRVYYQKSYRIKKKKPIFKKGFFWPVILAFLCLAGLSYFFFLSSFFQIKTLNVSGQEKVSQDDILNIADREIENRFIFFKTKSIFLLDAETIRDSILSLYPQVLGVVFERHLPDTLDIKVTERKPSALWCFPADCYLIDGQGIAFEELAGESDLIEIIAQGEEESFSLGEETMDKNIISLILETESKTEEKTGLDIIKVWAGSQGRLDFETSEGWDIYFNTEEDIDWQITKLGLVLEKEIPSGQRGDLEYIDLRFTRVYYK